MLYLDHAATTPVRPEVRDAMLPYLAERFGNPSSHHTVGEAAATALADARARVAAVLGMRTGDVVFTSGGTEANNLAVKGIAIAAALRIYRAIGLRIRAGGPDAYCHRIGTGKAAKVAMIAAAKGDAIRSRGAPPDLPRAGLWTRPR